MTTSEQPDFAPTFIKPSDADQVIEIERQELKRMGLATDDIERRLPDASELEDDLHARSFLYHGIYTGTDLIAFGSTEFWTPIDDAQFARNSLTRSLLTIIDRPSKAVSKFPHAINRIAVEESASDVTRFRATHGLLRTITRIADHEDTVIHTVVYNPRNNPIVGPLEDFNFRDTGLRTGLTKTEGVSTKYTRPRRNSVRGKKVPIFSQGFQIATEI
jgi:hypothetical protein